MAVPGSGTGPTAGQGRQGCCGQPPALGGVGGNVLSPAGWWHLQHTAGELLMASTAGASPAGARPGGQSPSGQEESCALPSWQAELCPSALILA